MPRDGVTEFGDFVAGSPDFDEVFADGNLLPYHTNREPGHGVEVLAFFGLSCGTAGEVGLMFSALGVREVGAIVLVHGEAEAAFEGADVILEAWGC